MQQLLFTTCQYYEYVEEIPLAGLHPNATTMSEDIGCSKDNAATWYNYVAFGVKPADAHCDTPIERNLALGEKYKSVGASALVFSDGTVIPGATLATNIQVQIVKSKIK